MPPTALARRRGDAREAGRGHNAASPSRPRCRARARGDRPPPPRASPPAAPAPGAHRPTSGSWPGGRLLHGVVARFFPPRGHCRGRAGGVRRCRLGAGPWAAAVGGAHRAHHRIVVRWQAVAWGCCAVFHPRGHCRGRAWGAPPCRPGGAAPSRLGAHPPVAGAPGLHRPRHQGVAGGQRLLGSVANFPPCHSPASRRRTAAAGQQTRSGATRVGIGDPD